MNMIQSTIIIQNSNYSQFWLKFISYIYMFKTTIVKSQSSYGNKYKNHCQKRLLFVTRFHSYFSENRHLHKCVKIYSFLF